MGGAGPIEKAMARQVGTLAAKSTFFFVWGGGQRAPPPPPFLPPLKAPTVDLQHVGSNILGDIPGSNRAARPPPSQGLQPKPPWAVAPSKPTLQGGALASRVTKGQMGCALLPCQKGALALAQLASPTAGCWALALGPWPHVWWPIAKQNKKWAVLGCAAAPRL